MGVYVKPPGQTTESFLNSQGTIVEAQALAALVNDPVNIGICLIDNGPFKAAGVAYDALEVKVFTNPTESRPRVYYSVPREALKAIGCNI